MLQVLGMPRDNVDHTCRPVINEPMRSLVVTEDVGPFRVTGLRPAVKSLADVLAEVKMSLPTVFDQLETAGMLCCRLIANSSKLSNHSWGCAVDISIGGILDGLGDAPGTGKRDGKTLAGLAAMAPIFNDAGWYWGVGFSNLEDGMHFEVADETIRKWHASGVLGDGRSITPSALRKGDRGNDVRRVQEALARFGFDIIPDGEFGPVTEGLVIDFQQIHGLEPDGIVGPETRLSLGL